MRPELLPTWLQPSLAGGLSVALDAADKSIARPRRPDRTHAAKQRRAGVACDAAWFCRQSNRQFRHPIAQRRERRSAKSTALQHASGRNSADGEYQFRDGRVGVRPMGSRRRNWAQVSGFSRKEEQDAVHFVQYFNNVSDPISGIIVSSDPFLFRVRTRLIVSADAARPAAGAKPQFKFCFPFAE